MDSLLPLLRAELTAVNQQFIHVLALRRSGDQERAARVYEVDLVDFPNAMRILDRLAASGAPVSVPSELPAPGRPMTALLQSELRIEERLQRILDTTHASDESAQRLIDAAIAPRAAYRAWLTDNLGSAKDDRAARHYPAIDPLFACLIAVLEHLMVRALVAWHAGNHRDADQAWASSGVAMVQVTELVNALTDLHAVPLGSRAFPAGVPGSLGDSIGEGPLMAAYARSAAAAMQETEPVLQAICARIVDYTQSVRAWRPGTPHPALASCAPSFRSFAATHARFVQHQPA
jgi:bacterioferritin (cytochrome b1)